MNDEDRNEAAVGENAAEKAGDARKTRGIRFSESEWDEVKRAAQARWNVRRRSSSASGFWRSLAAPESGEAGPAAPSLAPLIERMFRYTWFLATEKRDAMMREGRAEELDALVAEARAFHDTLRQERRDPALVPRSGVEEERF